MNIANIVETALNIEYLAKEYDVKPALIVSMLPDDYPDLQDIKRLLKITP